MDLKTEEMIALGVAYAINCQSCMVYHKKKAEEAGLSLEEMNYAIQTAQKVVVGAQNKTMDNAKRLLLRGTGFIESTDNNMYKLMVNLTVTLKNIEKASENLNRTLEVIADQPSQLVFGQPVPPRKIDK